MTVTSDQGGQSRRDGGHCDSDQRAKAEGMVERDGDPRSQPGTEQRKIPGT